MFSRNILSGEKLREARAKTIVNGGKEAFS